MFLFWTAWFSALSIPVLPRKTHFLKTLQHLAEDLQYILAFFVVLHVSAAQGSAVVPSLETPASRFWPVLVVGNHEHSAISGHSDPLLLPPELLVNTSVWKVTFCLLLIALESIMFGKDIKLLGQHPSSDKILLVSRRAELASWR